MKQYSAIIESLKISGAAGVSGKAADLSDEVKPTVVIKGYTALKGMPVRELSDAPRCDEVRMTGGISQSYFA